MPSLDDAQAAARRPIADSYRVPGTRLHAGEYPGRPPATPPAELRRRLLGFVDAGLDVFVDLTEPRDGLAPYAPALAALAAERGTTVAHAPLGIRDMDVCAPAHMTRVLDAIDAHLDAGRAVYVHCWGGVGRTGMVVGCWLVRHGRGGDEALEIVARLFATMSPDKRRRHAGTGSPQTAAQRRMVRDWARHDGARPAAAPSPRAEGAPAAPAPVPAHGAAPSPRDRAVGALVGLAVGDALGTTLEFTAPGGFAPIADMVGGGPFGLAPGQWTDDTSMALCLADSLLARGGHDPADQLRRYVRWRAEGHRSSTGHCFDIGTVVRQALATFERTGNPDAGPTDERTAGNGSLMRLAPVPIRWRHDPAQAVARAAASSRTTHGAPAALDACRYLAALLVGALAGVPKTVLLAPRYAPLPGLWEAAPLHPAIDAVAAGSFRAKAPPAIRGGRGYVVDTLEAALWAFATTDDFAAGALAAVNLGGDADTTGAVYGQLAGACYGIAAIPATWRARITDGAEIAELAARLDAASAADAAAPTPPGTH